MFSIYGGATEFNQWELDKLVTNPCMKEGDDVVFRNSTGETYVVRAFAQNGEVMADVPNYILQTAGNILVDLVQNQDRHDDCRTTFAVKAADKPDGYECTCNTPDRPVKIDPKYLPDNIGGGGGAGAFVVNLSTEDMQTWTADKTFEEIEQAHNDGAVCMVKIPAFGYCAYLAIVSAGQYAAFTFSAYSAIGKSVTFFSILVNVGGTVTVDMATVSTVT